jgi:hypothetical protein
LIVGNVGALLLPANARGSVPGGALKLAFGRRRVEIEVAEAKAFPQSPIDG